MSTPRNIVIVKPGSMGDVVHALPVAAAIHAHAPECRITWVIDKRWEPLLADNPFIAKTVVFPRTEFRGASGMLRFFKWLTGLRKLEGGQPDVVLDLQGLLRSAMISRAMRPKRVIGLDDAREGARWFYDTRVPVVKGEFAAHSVRRYLGILDALEIPQPRHTETQFPLPVGREPQAWLQPTVLSTRQTRLAILEKSKRDGWDTTTTNAELFKHFSLPSDMQLATPWNKPPGTSWYAEVTTSQGNTHKISIRDHGKFSTLFTKPKLHELVSKNWNPQEIAKSLNNIERRIAEAWSEETQKRIAAEKTLEDAKRRDTSNMVEDLTVEHTDVTAAQAKNVLTALVGKELLNAATGIVARIGIKQRNKIINRDTLEKSKSNGFKTGEHFAAASRLEILWKHAELLESRADRIGDKNVASIMRFTTPVKLGGRIGIAYLTAKESVPSKRGGGHKVFSLELIKIETLRDKGNRPFGTLIYRTATHEALRNKIATLDENVNKKIPSKLEVTFSRTEPFILVHPFSRGVGKSLNQGALTRLCRALAPRQVVLVGGASPYPLDENFPAVNLLGRTSLDELIWLIRRADWMISVDSGPAHIAAAVGTRLVAIHTWSDPRLVGPYSEDAWVWQGGALRRQKLAGYESLCPREPEPADGEKIGEFVSSALGAPRHQPGT